MKNAFYYSLPLALLFCGCNNNPPDSAKMAKEANNAKIDSQRKNEQPVDSVTQVFSKADAGFLVGAADGGMMEVQLGQLAQTKSANGQEPRGRRGKAEGTRCIQKHNAS